jgi:hypothetical protein
MLKSEIRSTKSETNPKGQTRKEANALALATVLAVLVPNFSNFLRFGLVSDFEFRTWVAG